MPGSTSFCIYLYGTCLCTEMQLGSVLYACLVDLLIGWVGCLELTSFIFLMSLNAIVDERYSVTVISIKGKPVVQIIA